MYNESPPGSMLTVKAPESDIVMVASIEPKGKAKYQEKTPMKKKVNLAIDVQKSLNKK